ncbi:LutC/YkgG family protein [Paraburkholderia sp. J12]|uniref:LutC/YkgG family protein n=1 Tax=Paraburkholderia sp. J12 TaxID=2805432 RepID=UPI002ABDB612|nr:LUD domain-containing protein [Paraburkholderia sp. J12]
MANREAFIARVRAAQPAALDLPEVPCFDTPPGDLRERFVASLALMGGREAQVASADAVLPLIHERFGAQAQIASAVPEVAGTFALDPKMPPASLENVDVGVVRARFAVAETGSVWLSEREYVVNALGYIVQHLVVLLDPAQIVAGLQDAYRCDDFRSARYAALVTGPSATADIEGVLIQGAQGVKSLTVVWLPAA